MKYLILYLALCMSTLSFSNTTQPCNCDEVAEALATASSPNAVLNAYADFQLIQLNTLNKLYEGILSSGHSSKINLEKVKQAQKTVQQGANSIEKKKSSLKEATITTSKQYVAELKSIHALGTKSFTQATNMVGVTKDGKYIISGQGDLADYPECVGVGQSMKMACLNALETMSDCGIYQVLGLAALREDQEKCDGKGATAMTLCAQTNGAYDAYSDMNMEETKAMQACKEHEKIVGGGNPAQFQTWDGF